METFRYVMAVLVILGLPPAIGYWLIVHPFVGFWRRLGTTSTFAFLIVYFLAAVAGLYLVRDTIAGENLGSNYFLVAAAIPFLLAGFYVKRQYTKVLTFKTLVGVPEVSSDGEDGALITEGIFGKLRHPRYLEFILGIIGWGLIINYSGVYRLIAVSFVGLYAVVLLEERELKRRFGQQYLDYMARVPRFIPRFTDRFQGG